MQKQLTNARRSGRIPASSCVSICWDIGDANLKFEIAKVCNISETGVSLRVNQPIPVHSYIQLRSEPLQLSGSAAVRYCLRGNESYSIGLEFAGGLKYKVQAES